MSTFIPNKRFRFELDREPEMQAVKLAAARIVAHNATENFREIGRPSILGPWMPRKGTADSQIMQVREEPHGVYVDNTDHGGHLMEWGSVNNRPHAPLRRAVHQAGLRLVENDKT